jgi:ubiquitin-protein ligase
MLPRLKKEYESLVKTPVHNTAVEWSEDSADVWFGAMYGLFPKDPTIPVSFMIHFDKSYPIKPPSVGFDAPFPFLEGASYVVNDKEKVLHGKFVICLDLLGNFAGVHGEWANRPGGWAPTCDTSYLLVQLYVVIDENLKRAPVADVDQAALAFQTYAKAHTVPSLVSQAQKDDSMAILTALMETKATIGEGGEGGGEVEKKVSSEPVFAAPTCCITSLSSQETLLFYGIVTESVNRSGKINLVTDCVPFSVESGLDKLPTTKAAFQFTIPCWCNDAHGRSPQWYEKTKANLHQASLSIFKLRSSTEIEDVMRVYPDLINTLILSMMKENDVRACSRLFEGIINLWRSFHELTRLNPVLQKHINDLLLRFTKNKESRLKSVTPDVGHTLVTFFANVREGTEFEDPSSFLLAFDEESSLRRPLWWQKDGISITPLATYRQSLVSVKIIAFQILFQKKVISATTLEDIHRTYCSLPELLDNFLKEWKVVVKQLESETEPWKTYYEILQDCGLPSSRVSEVQRPDFFRNLVAEASSLKGYFMDGKSYQGGKGGGGGRRHW